MATMTDFDSWIHSADLENYNDVYYLFKSVEDTDEWGAFTTTKKTTEKDNMYFVKCDYIDDVLMLASDKAKDYLLKSLEKKYCGEMDMEAWYYFKYEMEKND